MKKIIQKISWPIKEKLLSNKKKAVKRERLFPEYEEIKSCLVIWKSHPDEFKWMELIRKTMPIREMERVCVQHKEYQGDVLHNVVYVNSEEVDIKGNITNEKLNHVLEKRYDLLLDLNAFPDVMSDHIVRKTYAHCKFSMVKESSDIDIMIDGVENQEDLIVKTKAVLEKFKRYSL